MENDTILDMKKYIGKKMTFFHSPVTSLLGGTLIDVREGFTEAKFIIKSEWVNIMGTLHGGIIALIIDEMMGITRFTLQKDTYFSTVNLVIDYFRSVKGFESIYIKTIVLKEGKNILFLEAEVFDNDNNLIAKGSSNVVNSNIKKDSSTSK